MAKNRGIYVAVDSDILRNLTYLDLLKKKYGMVEIKDVKEPQLVKDFNYYARILNHVKNDDLRLLIVDAVYQESKHSEHLLNFMKEYCYFPNVSATNYQEKAKKARELAHAYCSPYEFKGQKYGAPMKCVYIADVNKYVPTNDAYIMAQATVEGCCVLTGNKKDFIFDKKQNAGNKDRLIGIYRINKLSGYYIKSKDKIITSKPVTIPFVVGSLKRDNMFDNLEQEDDKIQGRTIL